MQEYGANNFISHFLFIWKYKSKLWTILPFQACSCILAAIQSLSPSNLYPDSFQNEVEQLLISLVQTTQVHLSLMTSSLQISLSNMMEDFCNTSDNSDSSTTAKLEISDNRKQVLNTSDISSDFLENNKMLDKIVPDIHENITDSNSNTIKCGVSRDVVTMDIS